MHLTHMLCLGGFTVFLLACEEPALQSGRIEALQAGAGGFEARISGAYDGSVSGDGVLELLPNAGFDNQGYWFLADGQGDRAHGVTFVLPRDIAPGRHRLESPSPLELGTVPSPRVDRATDSAVVSYDKNTSGFLELTAFPNDERSVPGAQIAGTFLFETEGPAGSTLRVEGQFSYRAE